MIEPRHVGRSWAGHDIEDSCPCPKEPCGLVDLTRADPRCGEHPLAAGRTMRQGHAASVCPGA